MAAVMTLKDRYEEVRSRVARAAERVGRTEQDILVVAVSKYAEVEQIMELIGLGHQDFGESRVQQLLQRKAMIDEWLQRRQTLPGVAEEARGRSGVLGEDRSPDEVRWHLIGELQRNKVRKVIEEVRLVHSVDSLRVSEEIQAAALKREEPVEVLLQVNCSGETGKHGVALPAAIHVAEQIDATTYVHLRGIMTMAPYSENPEDSRPTFERGRECFEEISDAGIAGDRFNILSMGMSGDFEVAIDCGANLVRVGSALFEGADDHAEDEPEA